MSYCSCAHVLTSIASIANTLYNIELLYNSTVSMVTDAIYIYIYIYIYIMYSIQFNYYLSASCPDRYKYNICMYIFAD